MFNRQEYYERTKDKQRDAAKKWRRENRERYLAGQREVNKRAREADPVRALLYNAKARAKRKEVVFTIVKEDVGQPTHCPVLGIELCYTTTSLHADNSASLDRIVPELGYVPGNVLIISWRANRIKCDATLDELKQLVSFYDQCTGSSIGRASA